MGPDNDALHRFVFEGAGIRGEVVYLDAAWQAVQEIHEYPLPVANQLGQALAATALLSATIKLKGALILQLQGDGPLSTLVAQASSDRTLRGLARWDGEVPFGDLQAVFGSGRLVMTAENENADRYQGIVDLEGVDLSGAVEKYFAQSEQLPTRLWLAAGRERAAGLLLQRLPGHDSGDDWPRVSMLAQTLSSDELLTLPLEDLLFRLFHEERVRLFEAEPLAFRCSCSRGRIEDTLKALGRSESESILAEQGEILADCEFCNRRYRFDAVDVAALFAEGVALDSTTTH